ncbi:MAG TPA: response regulator transcription factor [Solirubrobacteraceae bacterium]|nr:response regulator transcription factor [Solirubrobacteraceae bacterium]
MKRVAIVAEDSLIVEAIAIGLRKTGEFAVTSRVDGRSPSAQNIIDESPDVVLIDEMEDPDLAVELIRQIKSEREDIAVIILTMSPDSAGLEALFDAGAAAAVSKAANPSALATLIRETIDGRVLHLYKPAGAARGQAGQSPGVEETELSARELEVLRLLAAGSTNGQIARKLWVTEQTVKFHLSNIYRKLGVANRTEASHYAHTKGLVHGGDEPAVAS